MGVQTRRRARPGRAARQPAADHGAIAPFWARRPGIVVTILTVVAAALGIAGERGHELWLDEAASYWAVTHGVRALLYGIGTDGSPPLYFLILKAVVALSGSS